MQKAVLITGCSSGIGLAAAKTLHQRGYRVLAACRKSADLAHMRELGLEPIELDLDDKESVKRAAEQVIELTNGRLFGLFNNGGFGVYGSLESISREQMEKQFSTNFFGTHQLTCLLLPAIRANGEGRIIQTSSVLGLISTPCRGAYSASKYALEAWSDALRMELFRTGIKVSLIEPGPINTRFTENVAQAESDHPVENPELARRLTLAPEDVVTKLIHALESSNPKLRYPVTLLSHAITVLRRLLPARLIDKIVYWQN
ncbi:SDR family oxidoreductase [Xenorhabdus budapestensis]|uniref:Putative short-chain type dehydrogenase/reductase n=1 Tax=Xenorhabdus budapestensis TaxID=290110 RepID=A0A2D0J0V5_XENBU|nr:SDR family oxidoreductase [Xenorhabdus budapestensis]PHM27855.1 putative short-chain type dehydrogenase/reductase [Xenorhabdus budapestensis]QTL39285.1 SDR family oxidoreductase [Xenorhabdus budapestensis]